MFFDDFKITHHKTGSSFKVNQASDYYPYGLRMATSWDRNPESANNRLYNAGNERNATTGWDETYFRMYDPAIGRFHGVDPLAVKYAGMTPYNYVGGNPIAFNDPLGDDYLNDNLEWVEYDDACGCMSIQTGGGSSNGRAWKQTSLYNGGGGSYGGIGVGSGNHWLNPLKTTSQNAAMMSSNTFMNYYDINKSKLSDGDYLMEVANKIGDRIDIYENWIDWYRDGEFIGATFQNYGIKRTPKIISASSQITTINTPTDGTYSKDFDLYRFPGLKITSNVAGTQTGPDSPITLSTGNNIDISGKKIIENVTFSGGTNGVSILIENGQQTNTFGLSTSGITFGQSISTVNGFDYGTSVTFTPVPEELALMALVGAGIATGGELLIFAPRLAQVLRSTLAF